MGIYIIDILNQEATPTLRFCFGFVLAFFNKDIASSSTVFHLHSDSEGDCSINLLDAPKTLISHSTKKQKKNQHRRDPGTLNGSMNITDSNGPISTARMIMLPVLYL